MFVPVKLTWVMCGGSFVEQGILVHNTNDGEFLSMDYSTNYSNVNVGTLMIISSSDINNLSSYKKMTRTSVPATPPLAPLSMSDKDRRGLMV
jgi:hypothetical protein